MEKNHGKKEDMQIRGMIMLRDCWLPMMPGYKLMTH